MKKSVFLILAVLFALVLLFVACDKGNDPQPPSNSTEDITAPQPEAHIHTFEEWTVVRHPTCSEAGEKARYCSCGEKQTEVIAASGHTEVTEAAVAPTCTATGLTEGKHCSACNEIIVAQNVVPTLAHTEVVNDEIAPTCTATGLTEGKHCSVCKKVLTEQKTIPAVDHTVAIDAAVAPTCTEPGLTEGKHCSVCEEILVAQQEIAANGHNYGDWHETIAPTESDKGENHRDCVNCDVFETEIVPELAHSHDRWERITLEAVAPTCTETGVTEGQKCSRCDEILVAQETVPALGHTEVIDAAVNATCTEDGLTEGKHCEVCSEVLVAQKVIPAAHTWSTSYDRDAVYHWHICAICNAIGEKQAHDVAADGFCSLCDHPIRETDGVYYLVSADGTYVEVIDYIGDFTRINIAEQYDGLPVKVIGESAFKNKNITSINMPDSVESIGKNAFYECTGLTNVTIGNGVTSIGDYAFYNCSGLTSITIPDSVESIGDYAFYNCSGLTSITIPDSVESIGEYAFFVCESLTNVTLGNGIKSINHAAFAYCRNLTGIVIPNSMINIGSSVFAGCGGLTSIIIPDSVTSIGECAFANCHGLTSVTIGNSVTRITSRVFEYCRNLTDIFIPDSVTYIDKTAFNGCTSLLQIENGVSYVGNCVIDFDNSAAVVVLREGTRLIGTKAFSDCTKLRSVTIPDSVTSIGSYAFSGCRGLTSITIPDSVTFIGSSAFGNCTGLTSITIPFVGAMKDGTEITYLGYIFGASSYPYQYNYVPASLKTVVITGGNIIGKSAFYGCTGLTCITIPDSVTNIGQSAFYNCTGLTDVYYTGTEEEWEAISVGGFNESLIGATIHYNWIDE